MNDNENVNDNEYVNDNVNENKNELMFAMWKTQRQNNFSLVLTSRIFADRIEAEERKKPSLLRKGGPLAVEGS